MINTYPCEATGRGEPEPEPRTQTVPGPALALKYYCLLAKDGKFQIISTSCCCLAVRLDSSSTVSREAANTARKFHQKTGLR